MSENKQSVESRRIVPPCARPDPGDQTTSPGDFCWDFDFPELGGKREDLTHFLYLHLPGEQHLGCIQVKRGPAGGDRVWGWDGNEERPTITPSIWHKGVWHGHLQNGRFNSCP